MARKQKNLKTSSRKSADGQRDRGAEAVIRSPGGRMLAKTYKLTTAELTVSSVYPVTDRDRLVDQFSIALDKFYVHLPRKKAIYGFDPVRALALLRLRLAEMSDAEFHESLTEIIARVRDRHVVFSGRAPYGSAASVPFTVESCWDAGGEIYVVTKIDSAAVFKKLVPGARLTHWNGIPIDRYVRLMANLFDGGNEAASLARSLAFLTHRPLVRFGPPLEEWVDLRFSVNGVDAEERVTWIGFSSADAPAYPALGRNLTGFGGDLMLMDLQNARRVKAAPQTFDPAPPVRSSRRSSGVPDIQGSGANGVFDYGILTTKDDTFAYLRFWSFRANDADELANTLAPILTTLPQTGLIFDIRGNTGGYIAAGERLLQLFSPAAVVPARFQFRITDATRAMAEASDDFISWRPSFVEAFGTGEEYTRGIPIEGDDADYNRIGRRYSGPVVLVSDALAFSTADIFAAGFIDNGVGKVVCTDANMAAAGGNNWVPWDVVRLYNPDFRLDTKLKADFAAGKLSAETFEAFNAAGISLSSKTVLSAGRPEYDGTAWSLRDGVLIHVVRDLPWMNSELEVYLARSASGLADMPSGITFSVTMRRSLRVKASEGRVLEDVGIAPDVIYRMTLRDVMEDNQDLFEFAGTILAGKSV